MPRTTILTAALIATACLAAPAFASDSAPTLEEAKAIAEKMNLDETRLANAGEGDTQTLRYTPEVGDSMVYDIEYGVTNTQTMGGMKAPSPALPTILFTFDAEVTQANGDDGYTLVTTVTKADAKVTEDDVMGEMTKRSVAALVDTTITAPTSPRGFAPDRVTKTPAGADEQAQAQIESIRALVVTVPLPEEAVANGAVWHHKTEQSNNGVESVLVTTYTLRRTDEKNLYLTAVVNQIITPGPVPADQMPRGATAEIKEGSGSAELTLIVDRDTGVSHTATCEFELDINLDFSMNGQQMSVQQDTTMTMKASPAKG